MSRADVAVIGLGPAGRALAHRLLRRGARVVVYDPAPAARWTATYGGWAEALPNWLPSEVVGARSDRTVITTHGPAALRTGEYVILDNDALQAALALEGATVHARTVPDGDLAGLADVVVDCRGARRPRSGPPPPKQTAYGVPLEAAEAAPLLGGADAVLMDWRPHDGAPRWAAVSPTFLYVVPLPDGRILAEETCLAADPAMGLEELRRRLGIRLARYGLAAAVRDEEAERVEIPMLPPPPGPVASFGAAGAELNPITGYSVFPSLARADAAARLLLETGRLPVRNDPWRPWALGSLLRLPPDGVFALFDAFARLPGAGQRAIFDPHISSSALLLALSRLWWRLPAPAKAQLVQASVARARR